ncbi:terpene synthase metal binding domain-containing protein [Pestalotiopsis sp. NC0098]|nr:terpene synthase metal binding domain-containing protein [Pestalotiopsis sp. NC0098]
MSINTSFSTVDGRVTISLPDLFKGFLVSEPIVNTHYQPVRMDSEQWLRSDMSLTPKQYKRVNYCDFSYFTAVLVPHAPRERLRVVTDWGNWVFLFDDMFDEGELTNDRDTSRRIINNLLSAMLPNVRRTSTEAVVTAHDNIFQRIASEATPSVAQRYVRAMTSYCAGVFQHVEDHTSDRTPSIADMLETRRQSIGVFPMYPLIEFAYNLDLPDQVFLDPAIQALENLGAEFVMLMNDILSYQKEESENVPFNMVAVCRINGSSAQNAFDEIASLVDERYAIWDATVRKVPSWGKDVDAQVQQYVQGIQNIVQANLSWSFRTGRYFGPKAAEVRKSRELDVLLKPGFLSVQQVSA